MATAKGNIVIKFEPKGDKSLIKAIKELDKVTRRLNGQLKKLNKTNVAVANTQKLVNQRVSTNVVAVNAASTAYTRLQSTIAIYRNKLLLAAFAVTFITAVFVRFVKMAAKQEASVRRLADVFGAEGAEALDKYSSELQKASIFGDENINVVMAQIGAFGASAEQTKELTQATIDLAAGMNIDLNTAGLLVAKTIGSTTDALTRYGVGAKGATEKTEKIANIVSSVEVLFGGLAKKLSMTTEGQLARAGNAFGDLGEELGRVFAPMILAVANGLRILSENLDAGKLKKFFAVVAIGVTIIKVWNRQLLIQKGYWITRNALVAANTALTTAWTTSTSIATFTQKGFTAALLSGKRAMQALNLAIKRNPIGLLFTALALGGLALANWMGWLNATTEELTDQEKQLIENQEAIKAYSDSVDEANEKLKDKLKLLKANSEIEKFAIQNGIELADVDAALFYETERLNKALKDEKDLQQSINKFYEANKEIQLDRMQALMVETELMMLNTEEGSEGYKKLKIALDGMNETYDEMISNLMTIAEINAFVLENTGEFFAGISEMSQQAAQSRIADITSAENAEIDSLRKTRIFHKMSEQRKADEEKKIRDKHEASKAKTRKEANRIMLLDFRFKQALSIKDAVMNTSEAYTKALPNIVLAGFIAALGAGQIAIIAAQQPPKMARGGFVGGRLHSQGGTLIEAEQGEFVMSRDAVNTIGAENLNRMNRGGGGAINVNFTGNVLSSDFIENDAIPQIKEAIRRGADIGIG